MNAPDVAAETAILSRRFSPRPLAVLFGLALRQHVRGKRLLVMSLLFALPAVLAAVVCWASRNVQPAASLEFAFVLNFIPHALAPLAALLYSAGIIQDEVEDQTLTYLLLRPLPRWALYWVKLLATFVVTAALTAVFTLATLAIITASTNGSFDAALAQRGLKIAGILTLAQFAYCGLFGLLGLLMRRSLLMGVGYIVVFEGLLASLNTVARRLTVMYYFRVLVLRWLDPAGGSEWSIDLTTAPLAETCVETLLGVGLVMTALAAVYFAHRELRTKTPEGS